MKGKYVVEIPQDDSDALSGTSSDIITSKKNINVYSTYNRKALSWKTMINKLNLFHI